MSSGGSQTSNHTASNPPASVTYQTGVQGRSKEDEYSRTARNAAADNTGHCYTCIEKFRLLLRFDFNAGEPAHLAHFTPDLLHAQTQDWVNTC